MKMTKQIGALLLASSLGLSGCASMQTENPYTGERETSKTAVGAGVGAVGGAIVGALVGHGRPEGMLIGAAVGGLAGGSIGHYMDNQESELRAELRGTGVRVVRHQNDIQLIMPGNITFRTDSSAIQSSFYPTLNSVARVIKKFNSTVVRIGGFTDSTGSLQYNVRLSEDRANSVASYLASQGVAGRRIVANGFGPAHPIASNHTVEGKQANRRVEITLQAVK
jgi:outer membrane protein OmpA-like peptidoglycan-associated protein